MNRVTDERLAKLIQKCGGDRALIGQEGYIGGGPSSRELVLALRELQSLRREGFVSRTAFDRYAWHDDDCDAIRNGGELRYPLAPCSCGFAATEKAP